MATAMENFAQFKDYRLGAIKFWECRRVVWNLLLVPPALIGYWNSSGIMPILGTAVVEPENVSLAAVAFMFFCAAIGANICYCAAYVTEFWMADSNMESGWLNGGRTAIFIVGCLIGIGLAVIGGAQIFAMLSLAISKV